MASKILVVDDEESIRYTFREFLLKEGYEVFTADDYNSCMNTISKIEPDLMYVDIVLGAYTGLDILRGVKKRGMHCPVVMITGKPNIESSAEAVRGGAFDYIPKPIKRDTLLRVTGLALRHKALADEKMRIEAERERYRKNLDAIFQSLKDGIITVDNNLNVIEANNAISEICGFKPQDIAGNDFSSLKTECHKGCAKVLMETLKTKNPVKEYRIECRHPKNPRQIVLLTSSALIDKDGKFMGVVLVVRDISRLTFLEEELKEKHKYFNLIGKSQKIQNIYRLLEDLFDTDTTVLITGESGTGKEIVARVLHYGSTRSSRPLISVNCSALAENLLESELFGHVKGAFTGAVKDKAGRFETADGGTLLLDEIGDISPYIQLKLLRVLQEQRFERVGESVSMKVDVRIIAATNQNLKEKVRKGEFREDLYYRLNVIEIPLPPLRERREDIPLLTDYFCKQFNIRQKKNITCVSDRVMEAFMRYHWPGNVRELEHAIEHAFVLCRTKIITMVHLPSEIIAFSGVNNIMADTIQPMGTDALLGALKNTDWNKAKAARILGISRPTLYKKMKELNLEGPDKNHIISNNYLKPKQ